jgi:hypothetical protein
MYRRLILLAILAVALTGCEEQIIVAPPTPEPVDIAGAWGGILRASGLPDAPVILNIFQSSATFTGQWSSTASGWSGTLTGTIDPDGVISGGTITISTAAPCTDAAPLSGATSTSRLELASPGFGSICAGVPGSMTMDLSRGL